MRRSVADPAAYMRRLFAIDDAAFDHTTARVRDVVQLRCGVTLERTSLPQCSRGLTIGRVYASRDLTERATFAIGRRRHAPGQKQRRQPLRLARWP
jgi:hypothetical protein